MLCVFFYDTIFLALIIIKKKKIKTEKNLINYLNYICYGTITAKILFHMKRTFV